MTRFADVQSQTRHARSDPPALIAALAYADLGWLIFPVAKKRPKSEHGRSDASRDPNLIAEWFGRWPDAEAALATGAESGIVALDVDISDKVHGPDSLDALGVSLHPETPTAHTPRGGFHVLFKHPGHFVKTIAGKLGAGLDIRGDGGSITLPPGPGRYWDPVYGLDHPLIDMPDWMVIPEAIAIDPGPLPRVTVELSRYAEVALDSAVRRIVSAPAGEQEAALNAEVFSIGRLAGGNVVPAGLALDAILWAARSMPCHDSHRPWRASDLDRKVRLTFADGLAKPRVPA